MQGIDENGELVQGSPEAGTEDETLAGGPLTAKALGRLSADELLALLKERHPASPGQGATNWAALAQMSLYEAGLV